MSDLVEFLRARLDEDEQTARACPGPKWEHRQIKGTYDESVVFEDFIAVVDEERVALSDVSADVLPFVLRHDPARVLAEVEAKRRLINTLLKEGDYLYEDEFKLLALPYADHPDYRDEWRP